tara:strand:+ start:532 stop:1089 length:558 start_codon:yes stop_codon:yes gene_type:complete
MTHILFHDEEEAMDKINIDELFEKNHTKDLKQLSIFKKLLNRIHNRIKVTSRSKKDQHIFFTVPEYIFGEPIYDKGECIGYLVVKLEENGFHVKYIHPCTLFVSWGHHVPSYVRTQFKKQTGQAIDEKGNIIYNKDDDEEEKKLISKDENNNTKKYNEIDNYKPSGSLIYGQDLFDRIENKIRKG